MNAFVLLALIALAIGIVLAWRAGRRHGQRDASTALPLPQRAEPPRAATLPPPPPPPAEPPGADLGAEKARIIVGLEAECAALRRRLAGVETEGLSRELADARAEAARYRQLLIDLENNAPPPLLDRPGTPDDLKMIVGVGPVLERMLQQLGIGTYRQIARWSERDIDEFDARLAEFRGRIRRDGWVTQARALHQSKYGETLPAR
jgi:predicted flap endonuclease-1-like 5' DNA nuclease